MPSISLLLLLLLLLAGALPLLTAAHTTFPDPDPAAIQPSLLFPSASSPPATIPAFPEQSDASSSASSTCPLDLSSSLLHAVSHSCSPSSDGAVLPSRSSCCPTLAAWLMSAYSATALRAPPAQAAAAASDLPVLPDDSEACADGAEAAIRTRGVALPRVNGTCGVAYCYCGVRLRRLSCPAAFAVEEEYGGRWAPLAAPRRRLERDCRHGGVDGCSRCLRSLNQLKTMASGGNTSKSSKKSGSHAKADDNECQMMGLTWLLSKNRTLYLPAATAILRSFLAAASGTAPASCSVPLDDMPMAVDSAQLDGSSSSAAMPAYQPSSSWSPSHLVSLLGLLLLS